MDKRFYTHQELLNHFKEFMKTTAKIIEENENKVPCEGCFADQLLLTVNAEVAAFMNYASELEHPKPK